MDVLFLDERRVTPVPTVLNMPSSHIAAQTSFLSVVLNMTKEGKKYLTMATSHLILKAQSYGYFKKSKQLLLFRDNV